MELTSIEYDKSEAGSAVTSGVRHLAEITAEGDDVCDPLATWRLDAACRGMDPAIFYAERGMPTAEARAVCAECPVTEPCLEYALAAAEKFGFWGACSVRDRHRIRGQRTLKESA